MYIGYFIMIALTAFLFSAIGTGLVLFVLKRTNMLDVPNERSNHTAPTPRGGGLAVMFSILGFMAVSGASGHVILGALLLGVVSFMDDRKPLPARARLLAQALAIFMVLMSVQGLVFGGLLPVWADKLLMLVLWLWFTNLFNFMDGIDGISGMQAISIGLGLVALAVAVNGALPRDIAIDGLIIAAAAAGFLLWNWHPARIFLGDVGSVPLGFLLGYLLLQTSAYGYHFAALIIPAYYLTDATLTLLKRALAGKPIWKAHSEHWYQKAVRGGRSHDMVVRDILGLNLILITLAAVSTYSATAGLLCLGAAYLLSLIWLIRFSTPHVNSLFANA